MVPNHSELIGALGKLSFFAHVIYANQQKQLWNDAFHVKTSQFAKN